jgi:hypothetical protein
MMEVTMETPKYIQQEKLEIDRRASKVAARRPLLTKRLDRLEESLYWLLSAAMLVYLLLGIIGR